MKDRGLRIFTIGLALGLYVTALGLPALSLTSVEGYGGDSYSGGDCLLFGPLTLLGGLPLFGAWLANIPFGISLFATGLARNARFAMWPAIIALALGSIPLILFITRDRFESSFDDFQGSAAIVSDVGAAYFLWLAAIATPLVVAALQLAHRAAAPGTTAQDAPSLPVRSPRWA